MEKNCGKKIVEKKLWKKNCGGGFGFFDRKTISTLARANFGKIANYDNLVYASRVTRFHIRLIT